jgi:outer membrane protein
MKLIKEIVLTCALAVSSTAALAASKVVVVDMEQALMATDVMQARVKKLTAEPEFAALKAKFDSLQSDLQSLEQEFQSNKMTWSDADKQGQRIKAEAKQKELRVILQSLKQQEQVAMKSVMQELGPKAKTALQQITTAQDIDIVLARNAALWRTESSDITAELTQRLNKAK